MAQHVLYGISDDEARKAHDDETSNHPMVHCNRSISWNELTRSEKNRFKRSMHLKRQGRSLSDVIKNGPVLKPKRLGE